MMMDSAEHHKVGAVRCAPPLSPPHRSANSILSSVSFIYIDAKEKKEAFFFVPSFG
jgi:hypothetical protein